MSQTILRNDTTSSNRPVPLTDSEIAPLMSALDGWLLEGKAITKTYEFRDYFETMAFVNATAWISHRSDHHPDLTVGYSRCKVSYSTHDAGGLTRNDFTCAAKLDALFSQ